METKEHIRKSTTRIPILGWVLAVILGFDILVAFLLTYANPGWQTYLYSLSVFVAGVLVILILIFLKFGLIHQAGIFAVVELTLGSLVTAFVFQDMGIPMQIFIMALAFIIVSEWLPVNKVKRIMSSVVVVSLLPLSFDLFNPIWRIELPLETGSRILIVGIIVILFAIYLGSKFDSYQLRMKLIFIFSIFTAGTIFTLSFVANSITDQITRQNNRNMLELEGSNLAHSLDLFLSNSLNNLQIDASSLELIDYLVKHEMGEQNFGDKQLVESTLNTFKLRDPKFIESYALLDINGRYLLDTYSDNPKSEYSDLYDFIRLLSSGSSIILPVTKTPDVNKSTITFATPIKYSNNLPIGILCVRYNADILQSIVQNFNGRVGFKSFSLILSEDYIVLAHGAEPENNLLSIDKISSDNLIINPQSRTGFKSNGSIDDSTYETEFVEGYIPSNEDNQKGSAVIVSLEYMPWKVAFIQNDKDLQVPIRDQANLLFLISEGIAVIIVILGIIGARTLSAPLTDLTNTANELAKGNLLARSELTSDDELGQLSDTLNSMAKQLYATRFHQEKRIKDRTQAMKTAIQVSQVLSLSLDSDFLINIVTSELQKAFSYYHVHIYLMTPENDVLFMVGGTGEVGEILTKQSHSIPVGKGLVGRAARENSTILAPDTSNEQSWLPNSLLPETKSELSVPISIGDKVIGVLDVQQNAIDSLGPQDVYLLELIAGQLAIALQNANQFEKTNEKIESQDKTNKIIDMITATQSIEDAIRVALVELAKHTGRKITATKLKVSGL